MYAISYGILTVPIWVENVISLLGLRLIYTNGPDSAEVQISSFAGLC